MALASSLGLKSGTVVVAATLEEVTQDVLVLSGNGSNFVLARLTWMNARPWPDTTVVRHTVVGLEGSPFIVGLPPELANKGNLLVVVTKLPLRGRLLTSLGLPVLR